MASRSKFKKGFKTFAENRSIELRKEVGAKPSHPLSAKKLADHLKARVLFPKDIPFITEETLSTLLKGSESAWSGVTLSIAGKTVIIVNSSHPVTRQESTIMHELAHIICGHEMGKFQILGEGVHLRSFDNTQEAEAEWLGGCLQLPRVALYYHYTKGGMSIEAIAAKFGASHDMVRYRMNVCGIK